MMPGNTRHLFFVKDYYAILGVRQFAGMAEVKRAYRQLVQKYHPDVNPDPSASDIIREINEAYEVLSDPTGKNQYDRLLQNPYQPYTHRQPEPQTRHTGRQRDPYFQRSGQRPAKGVNREYELVLEYFSYVKMISISGLVVCFILLIDYSLPRRYSVTPFTVKVSGREDYFVTPHKNFEVLRNELYPFRESTHAKLVESRLMGKIIEIQSLDGQHRITKLGTIYGTFKFVPIILCITALICLFMPGNEQFRFGLGVLTSFTLFFTIILTSGNG